MKGNGMRSREPVCQTSFIKLSSSFTLKFISAFKALNTLIMVSIVALFALLKCIVFAFK